MIDHIAAEDLAAYVDGALSEERKAELEAHFSRCPECLEALAEIVDIQSSRVSIPGDFLRQALGEKPVSRKPLLPLRLVFEIAAVFLVVVVIGYFYLGGNRFWRAQRVQEEKIAATALPPGAPLPRQAGQATPPLARRTEPAADAKAKKMAVEKNIIPAPALSLPPEKRSDQSAAFKDQGSSPADEKENREQGVKLEEAVAQPVQAEADKMGAAQAVRSRSPEEVAAGTVETAMAAKAQAVPPAGKGMAAAPRFLITGDAAWVDLLNPGLLDGWSWFKKGMILELELDGAGAVTAVNPVGQWERTTLAAAIKAARRLTFSLSEKKLRRARLSASGSLPN